MALDKRRLYDVESCEVTLNRQDYPPVGQYYHALVAAISQALSECTLAEPPLQNSDTPIASSREG